MRGFFTRWLLPIGLIVAGLLLSAFVFFAKLPEPVRVLDAGKAAALGGTPLVALILLVVLRVAVAWAGRPDRGADLVIIWVLTFLFGVHAAILAAMIGMVPSLRAVIPSAVAILLLGLGPAVGSLAYQSPLGIRTSGTLADQALWRRTHRLAGWSLGSAGLIGLIGSQVGGPWALVAGVGPAVAALILALAYASQSPSPSADEQKDAAERLVEESRVDATDP